MNHSKSATTIMICASASGVLLPPYTVYKSEHMWDTWTKGGPRGYPCCQEPCCSRGARYNRTSHGWMEAKCFTDWFETIFLPHAKRLEGQKVLIGDNLASHFTEEVLRLCEVNDISFVCLPPNSTHICQPLDVSFFRPFKIAWRAVLTQWKMEHKCESRIRKETFPSLLAVAIRKMDMPKSKENGQHEGGAVASNIISGFAATGIAPLNRDRVLNKIPHTQVVDGVAINDSLVEYLEKQRFPNKNTCARTGTGMRKKKIQVQPGKSVSAPTYDTDSSTAEEEVNLQDDSDDTGTVNQEIDTPTEDVLPEYTDPSEDNLQAGAYILVKFLSGKRKTVHFKYVCIIQSVINTGASREYEVLALKSVDTHKMAFCPRSDDVSLVDISDIIAVLPEPRLVLSGDRLRYHFNFTVDVKEV